ncbi:ABC transporter permease [Haloplanus aerogenes]|uniref:ABC transporter permease n=1 Tax=Haloplanus aerogenes TaxID=660522 RepID=A0A3M0CZX3_9EURY|nr:ABC transporter permease [Haloplanus aerogenes]AZH26741.1 ABC transporter permease [Haloplanus aerogenes]RMB12986.1 NitT/TauT family transport system permease protein [Haloplanus aerogenes]
MATSDRRLTTVETPAVSGRAVRAVVGHVWPPVVVAALVVTGWQWFVTATGVPEVILPAPGDVVTAGLAAQDTLLAAAATTALTATVGLLGGVVVGLTLAFAMVGSRTASAIFHPYLIALRIAPLIAIAPLVFLWIGDGVLARATLVATMTVFPVAIASVDGLRAVPEEYTDLARSVRAPSARVFLRIRIPAAAPSVFAGVKLGAALAVVGTVVAEFLTLQSGLGYQLFHAAEYLRTSTTFAALVVLTALGLCFYLIPAAVERRLDWG